ncbi:MAG TPA: hypothetical protein VNW29_04300 [Candidatus Sulfotelmatobacter sp.]|jgi:hypothetical protein|nr:hypothetical protein [Candidatus Sulfotelmatobacter sp.]
MQRFIKFIPSEEATWLRDTHPNAFLLLQVIAERARRISGHPDGLEIGECYMGDLCCGFSEQNYRTAKLRLVDMKYVKICETNRTRKKSTTGITTKGTKIKLISSAIWDINIENDNVSPNDCLTTDQRLPNDEQERTRKNKNEKEEQQQVRGDFSKFQEDFEKFNFILSDIEWVMQNYTPERTQMALDYVKQSQGIDNPVAVTKWHLKQENPPLPKKKKLPPREYVQKYFTKYEKYNDAVCFIDDDCVAFERGMNNHFVKFKEHGFIDQFHGLLRKFGIPIPKE